MLPGGARRARRSPGRWTRAAGVASALLLASLCATGCADPQPLVPHPLPVEEQVYVSIGDSYAAGDQPTGRGELTATRNGFAYQLADRLSAGGRPLRLLNFGCTGHTSTDVLATRGCRANGQGLDGPPYPKQTQVDAAINAMRAHPGRVRLVTVSIGGNDVHACSSSTSPSTSSTSSSTSSTGLTGQPVCVDQALATLRGNLDSLLTRIKAAVGPDTPVVGLTYPDVYLGAWVGGTDATKAEARASVELFRDRINPLLAATYAAHGAQFVDITALSGAYGPWEQTTELPPYGALPTPVARTCQLTNYCAARDLHPTTEGYTLITEAVLRQIKPG